MAGHGSTDSESDRWGDHRKQQQLQEQQELQQHLDDLEAATAAAAELDINIFSITSNTSFTLTQLKYFTFLMIGMSLLWPWNCFLTASAYYAERFAHSPGLIKIYSSTMMSISTIASTVFNYFLSQSQTGVDYNHRVNLGLSLTIGVFILMACTCVSDTFIQMKDIVFFVGLMTTVLISALATCIAQNGTMAIANVMGGIYANAVMVGQAIAGVMPSIALIASILLVGTKKKNEKGGTLDEDYHVEKNYGVFVYYITASLVSFVAMTLLYWTNYFKAETAYQVLNDVLENNPNSRGLNAFPDDIGNDEVTQQRHVPFMLLWGKLKYIVSAIFLTFSVSLVFPVFASNVESTHTESSNPLFSKSIFIPFIYLAWNLGDLLGRIMCGFMPSFVVKRPKNLVVYALARLIFIPLFFTCNIHPYTASGESSALINSDIWYVMLQFLFGLSNGQLCTSCFMIVRDYCDDDDEKEAAGGFTTVFLSTGLAFGAVLSYALVALIN
ncbi:nucleoside transporter Fun26p [[Candida] railenensis]|uniref:Nucleoside transporter Fun26p n=1 Tax=[Candida] railenensis TaxID=45579 RepID=A0A9P0VWJ3_9ASCO|nr:nucleoside transporter Fun26p [[Candida] railenensis]